MQHKIFKVLDAVVLHGDAQVGEGAGQRVPAEQETSGVAVGMLPEVLFAALRSNLVFFDVL